MAQVRSTIVLSDEQGADGHHAGSDNYTAGLRFYPADPGGLLVHAYPRKDGRIQVSDTDARALRDWLLREFPDG